MIIYDKAGSILLDIEVDDTSVRYKAIKGENSLTLKFSLAEHIEVPLGAYCLFKGELYSLMQPEDLMMNHRRSFEYTLVMYSEDAKAKRIVFINPVDGRVKFPLTAKPIEHLQMFVDNMNMRDAGWSVGECPDHVEITLSYNSTKCHDALVQLAEELELDYWFNGKVVNIGKLELNKENPLPLSYGGDGEGLKPNVKRTNYSDALPIEVLYVQGTETNIDASKYGASELHLPKGQTIRFDGTYFEDEDGFDESKARSYKTDENGYSVTRADKEIANHSEDSLDCSDIEPTKEEVVSSVIEVNKEKHFYDILFASDVDYSQYVIGGENATVVFQSGMLAGKEFDLATDTNGNLICSKEGDFWRVEIVPQDIDGITMPDEQSGYLPISGNTFKVFGIQLPDEYMRDAEMNMLRYAVKHFYANEDVQYTVSGELDEIYAKRNWDSIKDRLTLGSYISFSDKSFQEEPLLIRITGIKDYVNKPYSPQLEISNAALSGTLVGALNRIENQEVETEDKIRQAIGFSKRKWRDAKETLSMLTGAVANFTEGISPITVETMSMLIGDERLQFIFTESLASDVVVDLMYSYDLSTGTFSVQSGFIKHMTLGIDSISPVHADEEYKRWSVSEVSEALDRESGYYLYAKVSKDSTAGAFELHKAIQTDTDEAYFLLVGILNSEYDGGRSFASMYGFTEVRPGQITTDNIRSSDGKTWLDLIRGILHLNNMAGVSGVQDENKKEKSIAAWFGGQMQDSEIDTNTTDPAAAVIRHDGTGYFAKGNFSWDDEGGAKFGGGDLKIFPDGSIHLGPSVKITSEGDETLGSVLTMLAKFNDWFYLSDDGQSIGTKYNLFSERELSGHGLHLGNDEGVTSSLAGLIDVDLSDPANGDVLVFNGVHWTNVKQSDLVPDVDLSNYYTRQEVDNKIKTIDLSAYLKSDDAANTYAKLSDYNALKSNFDALHKTLNDDTTGVINTWQEVVDFVNEYSGSEDLATILSGMNADISSRLLASDFTDFKTNEYDKLAEAVAGHTRNITELTQRVGVAEGNINKLLGWFGEDENGDIYVKGDKNFYATKEVSSHGLHLGSGGAGLISSVLDSDQLGSNLTSDNTVVFNAYATNQVWSKAVENAGQIVSLTTRVSTLESKATKVSVTQALTSGTEIGSITVDGKDTKLYAPTIPSLSGGSAAEDGKYVSGVTVSGHTVTVTKATLGLGSLAYKSALSASDIPSLDWSKITSGKPTTISGYGITDAYTMSSVDSMLSRYLPIAGGTLLGNLTVNGTALFKNNLESQGNVIGTGGIICKKGDYQIELNYYDSGNRGLFDTPNSEWLIYTDGTKTYLPAKNVQIAKNLIVSGSVGLGTGSPQYRLDVVGNVGASGFILANKVYATSNIGIGTTSPTAKLEIEGGHMLIRNATSTDVITINNTNESKGYQTIRFERNGTDYAALQWFHDGFGSYTWNAVSCLNLDTAVAGGYVTIGHWGNPALMVNCDTSEVNITGSLTVQGKGIFHNNLESQGNVIGTGGIICKKGDYQIELNYYASGNRGLFDSATDAWLIYTNGTNTYLPAKNVQIAKNLIVSGSITIGDAELVWDGTALKISTSVYSEGEVSSRGLNLDSDIVAGEYLPIEGGTLLGSLTVQGKGIFHNNLESQGNVIGGGAVQAQTSDYGFISMQVGSTGNKGLLDSRTSWIIYTNGTNTFLPQGNVQIANNLTVSGTLTVASYISAPYYYKLGEFYFGSGLEGVGASGALIYSYNSNPIYFYTSGALRMSIDGAGQVGVTGPMTIANTLTIGTTTLTDATYNLTISKELNLLGGGTATDISSGIAAAFKTNRAQINTLIIDSLLLGADGSHKASTRSFKISKYGSVTSQAPSSITTLLEVSTAGNVSVVGSVSQGSDIRRKAVMEDKILSLDDMANAPLFTFIWNDRSDSTVRLGTSAQYWENVTPWLVSGADFKGLDYASLGVAIGISLARKMLSLEDRVGILELENKQLKETVYGVQ